MFRHRAGSLYVAVLGAAMIISICAMAGMHLARRSVQGASADRDLVRARMLARSGVEAAIAAMNSSTQGQGLWRTQYTHNVATTAIPLGGGTVSFRILDDDGSLSNDRIDPVWIEATGTVGQAKWVERAKARLDGGPPLEALSTVLHCSRELYLFASKNLIANGGPVSTDGNFRLEGTLQGNAHAVSRSGAGSVASGGVLTVPAARKGVAPPTLFNEYKSRATVLTYHGDFDKIVLGPGVNEYGGGANPDGIYFIDTAGADLTVKNTRLCGTLVVNAGIKKLIIDNQCFMTPARDGLPVILVKGAAEFKLKSTGGDKLMKESSQGHNFNPAGAPYLNVVDTDQADEYPSEIRGLVHIIGDLKFLNSGIYRGTFIVQGTATIEAGPQEFNYDADLALNPPWGYTANPASTAMIIAARSWSRMPSP